MFAHLVIIGGGSAAFAAALRASDAFSQVTIINDGLPIGGTCVNVGCVPSKTLLRAAQTATSKSHFKGISLVGEVTDFATIMKEKQTLVDDLRQQKYLDVIRDRSNVEIVVGRAVFSSPNVVQVGDRSIEGSHFLLATGARPFIPSVVVKSGVKYLNNESAFELTELPKSLIVLGGRYVALEIAQIFARLGSKVTVLQRSSRILPTERPDITEALTEFLQAEENLQIVAGCTLETVSEDDAGAHICVSCNGETKTFQAERLLCATGRSPNTYSMGLENTGVKLDASGFVVVSETLQTSVPNVYAAGDVISEPAFVYTAAYEGNLAVQNILEKDDRKKTNRDYTALPWVVFTEPQVAGVGMDETQAGEAGVDFDISVVPLSYVPRSLAARDTRGFVKLIRDKSTNTLIGGRIVAPEGSELLMEIALAIKYKIPVSEIATTFHPYLTLSEAIKLAAISFGKDVKKLSCCAA